jgi:DME family drug/metabolite transporter
MLLAPNLRYRLLLVLAAVLFSTGGVAIKAATLTPWQVVCFRSLVAALVFLTVLPEARRSWRWRTIGVSAAYAATLVLFVLATRLTTAANAIFLQSAAPLYLLLLSPWLLREPIRRADLVFMAVVACGLALFFVQAEPAAVTTTNPARGDILAAASGFTYALTLTGLRWLGRAKDPDAGVSAVAIGNLMAFAVALPMALPVPARGAANILVILYMGIFQVGLSYICVVYALRHVRAFEANMVLLLEPALNPVWVWLVQGEKPGLWGLAGGILILGSCLANAWHQRTTALGVIER